MSGLPSFEEQLFQGTPSSGSVVAFKYNICDKENNAKEFKLQVC